MDITTMRVTATVINFITFIGIKEKTITRRNATRFEEAAQLHFEEQD